MATTRNKKKEEPPKPANNTSPVVFERRKAILQEEDEKEEDSSPIRVLSRPVARASPDPRVVAAAQMATKNTRPKPGTTASDQAVPEQPSLFFALCMVVLAVVSFALLLEFVVDNGGLPKAFEYTKIVQETLHALSEARLFARKVYYDLPRFGRELARMLHSLVNAFLRLVSGGRVALPGALPGAGPLELHD